MKIKQNWQKTPLHRKIGHLLVYIAGAYSSAVMMTDWGHDAKEWNLYFAGLAVGMYQAGVKFLFDDDVNISYQKPVSNNPVPGPTKKDIEI